MPKFYGIEITYDEVEDCFHAISNYIHRDRNAVCLGLNITNTFIQEWYNEVNNIFSYKLARQRTYQKSEAADLQEIEKIINFMGRRIREPATVQSVKFLEDLKRRWDDGELKIQNRNRENDDKISEEIKKIISLVDEFKRKEISTKQQWMTSPD